ncbi:YdcF family protein [uncultured Devosia sp.]|uniref:YdcF family protein n=1 Tax=uncultured Devosia sp. TaxID=211434 RepID=UPI0035C9D208
MFFVVSKIFWVLAQPVTAVFLVLGLGLVLTALGRRRLGFGLSLLGTLALGVAGFTTLGAAMIGPLEARFERPANMPPSVGAIVMLGGGTNSRISAARGVSELNAAGDRFTETLRLAQLYPRARIVITGGFGMLGEEGEPEAATAARFFEGLGIAPDRLVLEDRARNTAENADFTAALLGDVDGPIVLVTSAFHMPRSVGLFRKAGLVVVPWPTDYRSASTEGLVLDLVNPVDNVSTLTSAIKEWIGLAVYHWSGRIDALFPEP